MEWVNVAIEWTTAAFEGVGTGPIAFPLAFLLGLVSAIASACCTLPVLAAVIGYSGMRHDASRRGNLLTAGSFMLGSTLAILMIGAVAGLVGQVAQSVLGKYWKIFAGIVAIVMGLAALDLLPFKPRKREMGEGKPSSGIIGAILVGLVVGGAVSVSSLACNPGIYIILGVAVLQGYTAWMAAVLVAYALGFSLPLAALVLGVSFGTAAVSAKRAETGFRVVAGILLIGAGFYFLWTF